ncbi:Agamous-like MADS-box protein AGL62 [Abeliophyllum distichum]|uniref:Agamous-like MADS-box protein AGL62 n=1 Tax=Abeliophyllum distichum TaxID=126358 RepID=A0ABD1QFR6_9LAMI
MSEPSSSARKKTQGRKKVEIKLIPNENARRITFSKRRNGLFKKATELSTLCGANVGIVVFSLRGKAYSFGHPNVESVLSRFMHENPNSNVSDSMLQVMRLRQQESISQQLKQQCDEIGEQLELLKKKRKEIHEAIETSHCQTSEEFLSSLSLQQLKGMREMMEKLKKNVTYRLNCQQELERGGLSSNVDLASVEKNEGGASPIPTNWLKL